MLKKGFGSPAGREKREDSKRERDREERRGKLTLVESKQNVCILEIEQK